MAGCGIFLETAIHSWHTGNDDINFELFVLIKCADDALADALSDLIFDAAVSFPRRSDKKLIFKIDIMLGVEDEGLVRLEYGVFGFFETGRPRV